MTTTTRKLEGVQREQYRIYVMRLLFTHGFKDPVDLDPFLDNFEHQYTMPNGVVMGIPVLVPNEEWGTEMKGLHRMSVLIMQLHDALRLNFYAAEQTLDPIARETYCHNALHLVFASLVDAADACESLLPCLKVNAPTCETVQ